MLNLPEGLDPEIARMLIEASQITGTGTADLPLAEARIAYGQRYLVRGLPAPDGISSEDIDIPAPWGALRARLYRGAPGGALVLYFHGGGFAFGDIAAYDAQSRNLAALSGASILTVEYRLAPEAPFPAALEDARTATEWALANAVGLGLDPARIGLAGDSAGGALSLATARALPGRIKAVLALYPVTDMRDLSAYPSSARFGEGFFLDLRLMEIFTRAYLPAGEDRADPRISAITARDLAHLPPTLVITAGSDPLRDQGEAFAKAAQAQGAPLRYHCEEAMIHNFMGHGAVSAGAAEAFRRTARSLAGLMA